MVVQGNAVERIAIAKAVLGIDIGKGTSFVSTHDIELASLLKIDTTCITSARMENGVLSLIINETRSVGT